MVNKRMKIQYLKNPKRVYKRVNSTAVDKVKEFIIDRYFSKDIQSADNTKLYTKVQSIQYTKVISCW